MNNLIEQILAARNNFNQVQASKPSQPLQDLIGLLTAQRPVQEEVNPLQEIFRRIVEANQIPTSAVVVPNTPLPGTVPNVNPIFPQPTSYNPKYGNISTAVDPGMSLNKQVPSYDNSNKSNTGLLTGMNTAVNPGNNLQTGKMLNTNIPTSIPKQSFFTSSANDFSTQNPDKFSQTLMALSRIPNMRYVF